MKWPHGEHTPDDSGVESSDPRPTTVEDSGDASAWNGGTAITGYRGPGPDSTGAFPQTAMVYSTGNATAFSGGIAITGYVHTLNVEGVLPEAPVAWPLQVGSVPDAPTAFQARDSLRTRIAQTATEGHTTVVLTGGGGVGKSHLAASHAREAMSLGCQLVVWANASGADQVIAAYAKAAHLVRAPGAEGQESEADARAFREWLATTPRSWLVVLDDIGDPEAIGPWWPPNSRTGEGQVIATTRRRDAVLSGGGRAVIEVDTYGPHEAVAYLRERLTRADMAHLADAAAAALVQELGRLPLALAHAAAYMINEDVSCASYLALFTDRRSKLEELLPTRADTELYGRQVATALLLALDAAQASEPVGLAIPAMRLAAVLDPAGHPQELWSHPAVLGYLAEHRGAELGMGEAKTSSQEAWKVRRMLHGYGLISDDSRSGPRAVRIHALTARATRETSPSREAAAAVTAAAAAVLELGTKADQTDFDLSAVLRANAGTLGDTVGDELWTLGCHRLLYWQGASLGSAGQVTAAVNHMLQLAADAERLLGSEHPNTFAARMMLAYAYAGAGRTADAISLADHLAVDYRRCRGSEHSETLRARMDLALLYNAAGRNQDMIDVAEQAVTEYERFLPEHCETLRARTYLAWFYRTAGRLDDSIVLGQRVVADCERLLGPDHSDTLDAQEGLAVSYRLAGRLSDAISLGEKVVTEYQRLSVWKAVTLTAQMNLSYAYLAAGRIDDALALTRQAIQDAEQQLGADHPFLSGAHAFMAGLSSYTSTSVPNAARRATAAEGAVPPRRLSSSSPVAEADAVSAVLPAENGEGADSIAAAEQALTNLAEQLGREHPLSIAASGILAMQYARAGRLDEAITMFEHVLEYGEQPGLKHEELLRFLSVLQQLRDYAKVIDLDQAITAVDHLSQHGGQPGLNSEELLRFLSVLRQSREAEADRPRQPGA